MTRHSSDAAVLPLFQGVAPEAAAAFLERLTPHEVASGDTLFSERDPGDTLYILLSGQVSLRCETGAGEVVELARLGPSEVFGELVVLSPASRSATALALTRVRSLTLSRRLFNDLLQQRDPAAEALLQEITLRICQRLRQTDARIGVLQDALRGASNTDLLARIERVVSPCPPEGEDDNWAHRLATFVHRSEP